jgi:acetyl esterase/lipase
MADALDVLERRAGPDREIAITAARKDYEDSAVWNDQLTSLASPWVTAGGPVLSSGRVFGPPSGFGVAQRPIASPASGRIRLLARLSFKDPGSGRAGEAVGLALTDRTSAQLAAPDFSRFLGILISHDVGANLRKVTINVNGTQTYLTQIPTGNADYLLGITRDDIGGFGLFVRRTDGTFFEERQLINPGTITWTPSQVCIFTNDTRGSAAGSGIGPVGWRGGPGSITPRTGLEAVSETLVLGGNGTTTEGWRLSLPKSYDSRVPMPLLIHCHGGNGTAYDPGGPGHVSFDLASSYGFIVASGNMVYDVGKVNSFGGPAALNSIYELYKWVRGRFPIGAVFLSGVSMGGLPVMNTLADRRIPGIAGAVLGAPVLNLRWYWDNRLTNAALTPSIPDFKASFGITSDVLADVRTHADPYDPMLRDASAYRGTPVLIFQSPADTSATSPENANMMVTKLTGASVDVTAVTATGPHGDPSQFDGTTIGNWMLSKAYA